MLQEKRQMMRYSEEILTLYVKGYLLFSVVPLLILALKIKHTLNLE